MITIDTTKNYELCKLDGTPLSSRAKKFILREMAVNEATPYQDTQIGALCVCKHLYCGRMLAYLHKYI